VARLSGGIEKSGKLFVPGAPLAGMVLPEVFMNAIVRLASNPFEKTLC
jgi:hypothetical protein